jgi:pimeloyl-ACP methyl ester carboxylesterase
MLYKLLKKPFFGSYMVKWRNPLSEIQKKDWQKIAVKSKSGATIQGLFAKSNSEKAKATIVLGHPMGKEAKGYFIKNGYTDLLRNHNYNVLVFDINGFGESSNGNFSYFEDILAIGFEAKKRSENKPIGYFGISLGGNFASIAFADGSHPYQFAIIESASTTLNEFWKTYPSAYKTLKVLNFLLPKYSKKINMVERIKEAKNLNSILFIYSEKDTWTPLEMGKRYLENCSVPAELYILKNATHANVMKSIDREDYSLKIIDYLDKETFKTRHLSNNPQELL